MNAEQAPMRALAAAIVALLAFVPASHRRNGPRLVTWGWDLPTRIWDAGDGHMVAEVDAPGPLRAATLSPDEHHLATARAHDAVMIWSASTGKLERRLATAIPV